FALAYVSFNRPPHAMIWSFAYFAGFVQFSANLGSDYYADQRMFWVVGGALALLVPSAAVGGFRLWAGRAPRWGWIVGAALAVWAGVWAVTFPLNHEGLKTFIGPAYSGLLCLYISVLIVRRRCPSTAPERSAALIFAAFGISQILAATAGLMQGATPDPQWLQLYRQINFLALPTGYIGMGLFTVLILASDLSEDMQAQARSDQLTGILNRRGFNEACRGLIARARRASEPLSLALCDIDHFKQVNDRYGHTAGDRALKNLVAVVNRELRSGDVFARMGGEEFAIVLPATDADGAFGVTERIRHRLATSEVTSGSSTFTITASFGITELMPADRNIYHLVRRGDRALYAAKQSGRDRSVINRDRDHESQDSLDSFV
ncbi:MAG: diguanylate cyclase, partial [Pseudomonadota bacterium]